MYQTPHELILILDCDTYGPSSVTGMDENISWVFPFSIKGSLSGVENISKGLFPSL